MSKFLMGWRAPCADAFSRFCFRPVLAAMLAVIALQATPAKPIDPHWDHGSAFSASTAEVALPLRRDAECEPAEPIDIPIPPETNLWREADAVLAEEFRWPDNRQTGPPARPPRSPNACPRAPPA